jgi:DNA-binding MarR family transcriptional regulator
MNATNKIDLAEIRKLARVLETFKEVDPAITLPSILALLYYAEQDNRSGNRFNVEKQLGMSNATGSRATLYWADLKAPRTPGKDFLSVMQDPEDRRFQIVTLTRKGLDFVGKVSEAMKKQ